METNVAVSMFEMFNYLMSSGALVGWFSLCNHDFFVTSSDSGSLVVSSLISGGLENPSVAQRVFWAVLEGLITMAVLLIAGEQALVIIQSAVVILGFPFAIMLLIMMVSLNKEL